MGDVVTISITLFPEYVSGTEWEVKVTSTLAIQDLDSFKAILVKNGSVVDVLDPLSD